MLLQPCTSLGVVPGSGVTQRIVLLKPVRPRPLQHSQVPALSGAATSPLAPRAVVLPRPLHHLQVPKPSSDAQRSTHPTGSGAALLPLQRLQVPAPSGSATRHHVPLSSVVRSVGRHRRVVRFLWCPDAHRNTATPQHLTQGARPQRPKHTRYAAFELLWMPLCTHAKGSGWRREARTHDSFVHGQP